MCVGMCVYVVTVSQEILRRRGDIMAGRGSELWPSQGHCTGVIFIDRRNVKVPRSGSKSQSKGNCHCF